MLDDAACGPAHVVRCGGIDCPDSPVALIERFLSEVGVTVEALREVGRHIGVGVER